MPTATLATASRSESVFATVRPERPYSLIRSHTRAMRQLEKYLSGTRSNRIAQKHPRPLITVAIPVCNEVERIARCVEALAAQRDAQGLLFARGKIGVVLLVNGSSDGTYPFILQHLERWRVGISAFNVRLPASRQNAASARHLANHVALDLLPDRGGMLFMTDADSAVPANWISRYSALLRHRCDAVAGLVHLHSDECIDDLRPLRHRGELEDRYGVLLDQLDCLVDPVAHDPWPRHYNASGANIAVRADALRGMEDFPNVACGEDRLFIRMMEAQGRRVRHDCGTRVATSARLVGRAAGGMADTLRHRLDVPDAPCDPRLEFSDRAFHRASLRRRLRTAWAERENFSQVALAGALADDVGEYLCANANGSKSFDDAWQRMEACCASLKRLPLSPCHLPLEIVRAETLLRRLSNADQLPARAEASAAAG